jgi:phosphatidylserine decarboxylase
VLSAQSTSITWTYQLSITSSDIYTTFADTIEPTATMGHSQLTQEQLKGAAFNATSAALVEITDQATKHTLDPQSHINLPSDQPAAHGFLHKFMSKDTAEKLEARFHMGNYVIINRQTGEKDFEAMSVYVRLGMHLLYYGSLQEDVLHTERVINLLKAQSEKMGVQYDDPASKDHIVPFIESFQLQDAMKEMVKPDPLDYATFNEFFAREIRPDARPPAEPANPAVVSSPADCRLTAFPTVDLATEYWIKGFGFTLEKLLGSAELAQQFEGGSLVIARLAPQDYHRWHAPTSGTVISVTEIPGTYYTVNPQAINEPGTLDVFCENRRSVMTLQSDVDGSPFALVAVGAMLVGSIKYVGGANAVGKRLQRAQCTGAFYYGGSTVIVLYPKGAVVYDEDIVKASTEQQCETLVRVGERIGVYASPGERL